MGIKCETDSYFTNPFVAPAKAFDVVMERAEDQNSDSEEAIAAVALFIPALASGALALGGALLTLPAAPHVCERYQLYHAD